MRSKKPDSTDVDQAFLNHLQNTLDDNLHDIDGDTRQQLRAMREDALAATQKRSFFSGPRAVVALAIASAAIVLIPINRFQTADLQHPSLPQPDDYELLESGEPFELLSNLEMYQWMILEGPAVKS